MIKRISGMISVVTKRVGVAQPLFPEEGDTDGEFEDYDGREDYDEDCDSCDGCEEDGIRGIGETEELELLLEGRLVTTSERAELVWLESELTGMEGSTTKLGFSLREPGLVSMLRSGTVNTALVFEQGVRHTCLYHTPFSSFEVCVQGLRVENSLLTDGRMELDYLIELRGNRTERCRMSVQFRETK